MNRSDASSGETRPQVAKHSVLALVAWARAAIRTATTSAHCIATQTGHGREASGPLSLSTCRMAATQKKISSTHASFIPSEACSEGARKNLLPRCIPSIVAHFSPCGNYQRGSGHP